MLDSCCFLVSSVCSARCSFFFDLSIPSSINASSGIFVLYLRTCSSTIHACNLFAFYCFAIKIIMIITIKLDAAQIHEEPRVRRRVARVAYGMTPALNPPSDDLPSGTFDASRGRRAVSTISRPLFPTSGRHHVPARRLVFAAVFGRSTCSRER